MTRLAVTLTAFIAVAGPASAHDFRAGQIEINHPWSRPTSPSAPVAGRSMKLTNTGAETDRLIEVTSPIAERAEIHRSVVRKDRMRSG
jgi:copper(I)-binding protein